MKQLKAPELDGLLRALEIRTFNPDTYDTKTLEKLNELYQLLDKIKPIGDDELKVLYFSVERGTIEDYGDYEELKEWGDVSSYEEFEECYKEEYPDEIYWYRMVTSRYKNYLTISVNYKTVIYADTDTKHNFENNSLIELLDFLIYKVKETLGLLENNTYNDYILNNLSYNNRFGVIKRSDYWRLYPETKQNLLKYLPQEEIDEFLNTAEEMTPERIKDMTAGKYFECVRLAYLNNDDYEVGDLTGKELYLKYADGRDMGLTQIDPNSPKEFDDWYNDKNRFGGHPWEIIRGHSFARVNLSVGHDENGYYLALDGSRILRKVEIVKIYLALKQNNIPVHLYSIDIIKKALSGSDYIGIVPRDILPIECGSYFTDEYKPREFINDIDDKILDFIIWEPLEKLYLESK